MTPDLWTMLAFGAFGGWVAGVVTVLCMEARAERARQRYRNATPPPKPKRPPGMPRDGSRTSPASAPGDEGPKPKDPPTEPPRERRCHTEPVEVEGKRVRVWCPACGDPLETVPPTQLRRPRKWPPPPPHASSLIEPSTAPPEPPPDPPRRPPDDYAPSAPEYPGPSHPSPARQGAETPSDRLWGVTMSEVALCLYPDREVRTRHDPGSTRPYVVVVDGAYGPALSIEGTTSEQVALELLRRYVEGYEDLHVTAQHQSHGREGSRYELHFVRVGGGQPRFHQTCTGESILDLARNVRRAVGRLSRPSASDQQPSCPEVALQVMDQDDLNAWADRLHRVAFDLQAQGAPMEQRADVSNAAQLVASMAGRAVATPTWTYKTLEGEQGR